MLAPFSLHAHLALLLVVALCSGCERQQHAATRSTERVRVDDTTTPRLPDTITLMTYNTLADPVGGAARSEALLELIDEVDADVIALQEVAPWFDKMMAQRPGFLARYAYPPRGAPAARAGLLILSKFPVHKRGVVDLTSRQGRKAYVITARVGNEALTVVDVHLDSLLELGPVRATQLRELAPHLTPSGKRGATHAVLMGDFNFGDGEQPDTAALPRGFVDAWRVVHGPEAPGFTWDMERSWMAKQGAFKGEASRRLDRILVQSPTYQPTDAHIVGQSPISDAPQAPFPSDHFGLVVTLERR